MKRQLLDHAVPEPVRGRDRQLAQVLGAVSATDGRRRTLLLTAPTGSGKTRLLREAAAVAEEHGFTVVDAELAVARRPHVVAPDANWLSWLTAQLARQVESLLRRGPVLVTVDDLHWADPLMVAALRDLMHRLDDRPVVWIFAMRAEDLDSPNGLLLNAMATSPRTEWLAGLDPLPDAVVAEIVTDRLGVAPNAGLAALCECMGGNPRAILDLLHGLLADGALRIAAEAELTSPLPQRFLGMIRDRLERLDPATQQVVQVAAVLGRRFGPHDLAAMLSTTPAALLKPLQEAMAAGFVDCHATSFEFRREPVWQGVLETVPPLMLSLLRKQAVDCQPEFDPQWTHGWRQIRRRQLTEALDTINTVEEPVAATTLRSWVSFVQGDLVTAQSEAQAGLAFGIPVYEPYLQAVLVLSALRRGIVAAAADRLETFENQPWSPLRTWVTAQVAAARSGPMAALAVLAEVRTDEARRRELLLEDPAAAAWCVRTALAAGDDVFARTLLASAEDLGAGAHARALYDRDVAALVAVTEQCGDRWSRACAVEDLGVLLAEHTEAVNAFDRAMELYDSVGAAWDSARVRSRLRALGVRRRHWQHVPRPATGWDSLTDTEEKVARLVAHGLTNRQVAAELFVSPHTVGFHLRQIYRKLAIQSRVDLARIAP